MKKKMLVYFVLFLMFVGFGCIDHNIPVELKLSTLNPPPEDWGTTCFAPSDDGGWIVKTDEQCTGGRIILHGSLRVENGASLTLKGGCELMMDGNSSDPPVIEVMPGGTLRLLDGCKVHGDGRHYIFYAHPGSTVYIENAEISDVGVKDGYYRHEGVYIGSDNAVIKDSYFHDNLVGLILEGKGSNVQNNKFEDNQVAVKLVNADANVSDNEIYGNGGGYGIVANYTDDKDHTVYLLGNTIRSVGEGIYVDPESKPTAVKQLKLTLNHQKTSKCGDGVCDPSLYICYGDVIGDCSEYNRTECSGYGCSWEGDYCSGEPTSLSCSNYTDEESCRNVHCEWVVPKYCEGTPNVSCSDLTDENTCKLAGCVWSFTCSGTPNVSCSDYSDDSSTCSALGCIWNPSVCSGSVNTTCDQITDPSMCTGVGCEWDKKNNKCYGEILPCKKIKPDYCEAVGCSFTPSSCTGEVVCENIKDEKTCNLAGCSAEGLCSGEIECGKLTTDVCKQFGCTVPQPYCSGKLDCKAFTDESECNSVEGCSWVPGKCSGTFACSNIREETYCLNAGCSWGPENETTCPEDCAGPVCGNGKCEEGEDYYNCPQDCQPPDCKGTEVDDCSSLQVNDPKSECGKYYSKSGYQCTVNKDLTGCANGDVCKVPQQTVCGNGILEEGEECDYKASPTGCKEGYTCTDECICKPVGPVCGDGKCDKGEKCSQDCSKETWCSDGVDNDMDSKVDCEDDDCSGDPACAQPPTGETDCADGKDNDNDGLTDCADSDCSSYSGCTIPDVGKSSYLEVVISENVISEFDEAGIDLVGLKNAEVSNNMVCNGTGVGIVDNTGENSYKNNTCDSSKPSGLCDNSCTPQPVSGVVDLEDPSTYDPDGDGKPNIVRVEIEDSPGKYRYVVNDDVVLAGGKVYNIPAHSPAIQINCSDCVFDCNGSTIVGDGTGYGIENNGYDNVTVRNCKIENYDRGIYWDADNGRIENNTVNSNTVGIHLYFSSNNILIDNTATHNDNGIYLDYSSSNTLIGNTASNNSNNGIHLLSSFSNILTNNTANSNAYGISLASDSSNNTLTDNTATNNGNGIYLVDRSSHNTLTNNTANNNNYNGIWLSWLSSNNTLTNNTACNNSNQDIHLRSNSNSNSGDNICDKLQDDDSNSVTCSQSCSALQPENCSNGVDDDGDGLVDCDDPDCEKDPACQLPVCKGERIPTCNVEGGECDYLWYQIAIGRVTRFYSEEGYQCLIDENGCRNGDPCLVPTESLCVDGVDNDGDGLVDCDDPDCSNDPACQPTCVTPTDGMLINESVVLCPGVYNLPNGIKINADNIEVVCNGTILNGSGSGNGIENNGYDNVTVRNCKIEKYERGIYWHDGADNGKIENNTACNNEYGILLRSSSSNNNLTDNTANDNSVGILFDGSGNNIVGFNTVNNNRYFGIATEYSNIFKDNEICDNGYEKFSELPGLEGDVWDFGSSNWTNNTCDKSMCGDNPPVECDLCDNSCPAQPTCCNLTDMSGCDNVSKVGDSYYVNGDTKLCSGKYQYTGTDEFIIMNCTNCTLDCAGAHLIGSNKKGYGIIYSEICEYNYTGPTLYQTIKNCEVSGFKTGISKWGKIPAVPLGTTCYRPDIILDSVYSHDNLVGLHGPSTSLKDKVHIIKSSFKNNCFMDVEDWNCRLGNNLTLTGSNDLPILILRDTTINLRDNTYTEVLLCNVTGTINNITLKGSNYNNMLRIGNSKNLIISNLDVIRSNGVAVYSTNDSVIRDSELRDNTFGLVIDRSVNISIINNTIIDNKEPPPCADEVYGVGVYLHRTNSSLVEDNSILNNRYFGILLYGNSTNNIIRDNVICGNGWDQSPDPSIPEGDITEVSSTNNSYQDNKCDVSNPSGYCDYSCHEQNCTNTIDDDNDGLVDCEDPDCYGRPECQGTLVLDLIEPTDDITIPAGSIFQFKVNVSCSVHDCGDVNVTLDPPGPYADWNYVRNITVDHYKIGSDLADFPVLIVLNRSNFDFSKAQPNGEDIRFTDANDVPLSYEIEYWNSSGELAYIWVKLPKVFSARDTIFYMYYGNPNADDGQNASDVWSNHYIAVYHMNDVSGGEIRDSSPYSNNGQVFGNTRLASGRIGNGLYFDGSADYVEISSMLNEFDEHEGTIELYTNFDSSQNPYSAPWGIRQSRRLFEFTRTGAGTEMYYRYPYNCNHFKGIYYTPFTWEHWSFTWSDSGSFGRAYKNGSLIKSSGFSSSCLIDFNEDFFIGATDPSSYFYYRGYIDEFRVSDVARSDAWLSASYYSQENQLLTVGEEKEIEHGKGIVPEGSGEPFYTISHNPATPNNTPCLADLHKGESCLVTWTVVDVNDTTTEFYAVGVGENAPETESRHINVTVSGNNPIQPVMLNISISPSQPNDDDNLTCSALAIDNDSATLVVEFEWYLGNTHMPQFDSTETCTNGTVCNSSVKVPSSATSQGENWTCSVRAFDGSHYSDWTNDTVEIAPAVYVEICTNDIDDDGDGLVDCRDPDCYGDPACRREEESKPRMDVNRNDTCMARPVLITVLEHDSGRPIDKAKVYVNSTLIGYTDEDGHVVYVFNTTGPYEIVVRHEDYRTYHDDWVFVNCTLPSPGPSPGENETVSECVSDENCLCNESCVNGTCQPVVCGEGYVFDPNRACHTCSYTECLTNEDCPENESCENGVCVLVPCDCGVIENHKCIPYECCLNSECSVMQVCLNHTCVPIQSEEGSTISSETISGLKSQLDDLYKRTQKLRDTGEISDEEYHEYIQRIEDARRALSEGRIDYVETSIQKIQVDLSPMKRKITNLIFLATILIVLLFLILLYKRRKEGRKKMVGIGRQRG